MMKTRFAVILFCMLLSCFGQAYAVPGYSEINNALFDKSHLKNINESAKLTYKYQKTSYTEGNREDTIVMSVDNIRNTGRRDTQFEFFTGKHNRPYQAMNDQRGNPIFVYFLEFDVHEMDRLTGGEWRYFQRKLRWAMAAGADKKQVEIDYQGKKVEATQYTIQPYVDDPKNGRYKLYAGKYYIFTLSEAVPGEIYQIRTVVPDGLTWDGEQVPLIDETVTLFDYRPEH
ncbi:hypothetical protein Q7C_2212 [Methylophaga frappieri]|uniref:Uncharacterized protein n=1 Tax=Methylophaga frappieri (strain ATCC BAA-2434 / DSM 25690 / JAM7) TaxID=754477 RepID=I1YKA5_METFJ|nr:hypothetical protein [Methylophaga frappieri]AFJ03348.1 hypothetical protein Q7C_2212 [Methylophaga frappieri]